MVNCRLLDCAPVVYSCQIVMTVTLNYINIIISVCFINIFAIIYISKRQTLKENIMNVSTLAKAMNVTESDVTSLINMVTTSMMQDKMAEIFLNLNEEDRVDVVSAYIQAEIKKFSNFCVSLLTNQEKKSAFDQYIYFQLSK